MKLYIGLQHTEHVNDDQGKPIKIVQLQPILLTEKEYEELIKETKKNTIEVETTKKK